MKLLISLLCSFIILNTYGQTDLENQFINIETKVIEWRRDFHKNPELSNREFKTAKKIGEHLKSLGLEVQTFNSLDNNDKIEQTSPLGKARIRILEKLKNR